MKMYDLAPANFNDYRDFLFQRFEDLKASNPKFSINALAAKSKISKSLLQFIFKKKRHISFDKFTSLAKGLKLNDEEEAFIYMSICKDSSKNPKVKAHFESILSRIRNQNIKTENIVEPVATNENRKSLYLNFLFMLIQSMVRLPDFKEDPQWIAEKIIDKDITKEKVESTLSELLKLGYLKRDENGKLKPLENSLWKPDPYDPTGNSVYTKAAENMADLMQNPGLYKPAVYMSMTLTFDEDTLKEAEKFMIEVHHQLCKISGQSKHRTAIAQFANFMLTVVRL